MIPIDEHELTTDHMTKQCNYFMERVEAKIGNSKQPLFYGTYQTEYFKVLLGTHNADNNVLPYG